MELPQYDLKHLPVAYRALFNRQRPLPDDVDLLPSLPDAGERLVAMLITLPVCGAWLYVVNSQVFASYHPGSFLGTIFYMVTGLIALVIAGQSVAGFQATSAAATEARNHRWRYGVFLHRDWLLIRHHPSGRLYHIAHHDVEQVGMAKPLQGGSKELPQIVFDHASTQTHHDWNQVWRGISKKGAYERLCLWHTRR